MGFVIEDVKLLEAYAFSPNRAETVNAAAISNSVEKFFLEGILALNRADVPQAQKQLDLIKRTAGRSTPAYAAYEELRALIELQSWDKGAAGNKQLQQYLTDLLGLRFSDDDGVIVEQGMEGLETEEPQHPTVLSEALYTIANLAEGHSPERVFKPVAHPMLFADERLPFDTRVGILMASQVTAALPGVVPFLRRWQQVCEAATDAAHAAPFFNYMQSYMPQFTAEQLQEFATGNTGLPANLRLLRQWQAALLLKLQPDDTDLEDPSARPRVMGFLQQAEQLCNQLGASAQWIRLHVLYTRLVLLAKSGTVSVAALEEFLRLSAATNWPFAFSSYLPASRDAINPQVHQGISCDICRQMPIVGTRYRSQSHFDWDVCSNCYPTQAARAAEPYEAMTEDHRVVLYVDDPALGGLLCMPRNAQEIMEFVHRQVLEAVIADGTTHLNVICDLCGAESFRGTRHHSLSREDFDCCDSCRRSNPAAPDAGPYEEIQAPARLFSAEANSALAGLLAPGVYQRILAEGWLLSGAGNVELSSRWYVEAHGDLAELTNRRELLFRTSNKRKYGQAEPVLLRLTAKNVPSVLIKVWEINSWNYYCAGNGEIDAQLDLTGLGATIQESIPLDSLPPLRRSEIEYSCLEGRRGVFVVDVVAAGLTQRAVIRKGGLRYTMRLGLAGHVFRVCYDDWTPVQGAKVYLDGREHSARPETGEVILPYAANLSSAGSKRIVLGSACGLASLAFFDHKVEVYQLSSSMHLERETLLPRSTVPLLVRLGLSLHGQAAPLKLLERLTLTVEARDASGSEIAQAPQELAPDPDTGAATHQLRVPEHCSRITVTLNGRVQLVAPGVNGEVQYQDVNRRFGWEVNAQNDDQVYDMHLQGLPDGTFALRVLGRAGEAPRKPVALQVKLLHRIIQPGYEKTFDLSTNAQGTVQLGKLTDIEGVAVEIPEFPEVGMRLWHPRGSPQAMPPIPSNLIHCQAHLQEGLKIAVPRPPEAVAQLSGYQPRLYRVVPSSGLVTELPGLATLLEGQVAVGPLEAGRYALALPWVPSVLAIVAAQPVAGDLAGPDWLVTESEVLPVAEPQPLAIASASCTATEGLLVQLAGSPEQLEAARVTAVILRFVPPQAADEFLTSTAPQDQRGPTKFCGPFSDYLAGGRLDVGTLYVMQRRALVAAAAGKMRPGNLLEKPSLLVHPSLVRDAATSAADVMRERFAESAAPPMMHHAADFRGPPMACMAAAPGGYGGQARFKSSGWRGPGMPALGFCPTAVLLPDLHCGADGKVVVDVAALQAAGIDLGSSGHTYVRLAAATPETFASMSFTVQGGVAPAAAPVRDVGLQRPWAGGAQCVEAREVTVLLPGAQLVIAEPSSAKFCVYDSLERVQLLFTALLRTAGSEWSRDWSALARWPSLSASERSRMLKDQWSCELLTFIKLKDPQTFASTVRPILAGKMKAERTFLDWWLLDELSQEVVQHFALPQRYGRLNVFEKILLAAAEGRGACERLATDMAARCKPRGYENIRRHRDRQRMLFDTALSVGDLEVAEPAAEEESECAAEEEFVLVDTNLLNEQGQDRDRSRSRSIGVEPFAAPVSFSFGAPAPAPPPPAGEAFGYGAPRRLAAKRMEADMDQRVQMQSAAANSQLFKKRVKTQEWVETGFLKQGTSLVSPQFPETSFWADYAAHRAAGGTGPFLSKHLAEAAGSLSSAILALALLDLPFPSSSTSAAVSSSSQGGSLVMRATSPALVYHRQVLPATAVPDTGSSTPAPVLVAQHIVDVQDRYIEDPETGEQQERWVDGPLLVGRAYALAVTVTSLVSSHQELDLLLPIPQGALPLGQPRTTATASASLQPYASYHDVLVSFYFPHPGQFAQSPVSVTKKGVLIAGPPAALPPLDVRTAPPPGATQDAAFNWEKFVVKATDAEVISFLTSGDLTLATDLNLLRSRCANSSFFAAATAALRARQQFPVLIWQYAVRHMDGQALKELLAMDSSWQRVLGPWVEHPLVQVKPTDKGYRHLEYCPVINRFVHPVPRPGAQPLAVGSGGGASALLEDVPAVRQQWLSFLNVLLRKPSVEPAEAAEAAYYLLLQDRISEAEQLLDRFLPASVTAEMGAELCMQLDYMRAWLAMSGTGSDLSLPTAVAAKYRGIQDKVWSKKFGELDATLRSMATLQQGSSMQVDAPQEDAGSTEAVLTVKGPVDSQGGLAIYARNLMEITVNLYEMDIELLFSAQPFAQLGPSSGSGGSSSLGKLAYVRPTATARAPLAAAGGERRLDLAGLFPQHAGSSVLFELQGGGLTRTVARYGSGVVVHVMERQGLLQALDAAGRPLVAAYVKAYARQRGGEPWMHKDGYTDRLGKFDYASVAETDASGSKAQQFALLVVAEGLGAAVAEATALDA